MSRTVPIISLVAVVLVLSLLRAARARADDRPRVAALVSSLRPAALARLRAELTAAGFELQVAQPPRWPPSRDEIVEIARREGAVAALAVIPRGTEVEIWLVDRVTGKTVVRELVSDRGAPSDDADLVAICAVEMLRATLMEIALPHPSRGEIAPSPAVRALVRPDRSRFAVRIASAVGFGGPGALGPVEQIGLCLIGAVRPRLRLGLDGFIPLIDATVTGPEGRAEVGLWLLGAFVEGSLTDPSARVDVIVGGGAWFSVLSMTGGAVAPYVARSVQVKTLATHLDLGARARLARRVALVVRLSGAVATPEAAVRFAGRNVASWGRPFALGALLLEVGLD